MKRWTRYQLNRFAREAEERGDTEIAARVREAIANDVDMTTGQVLSSLEGAPEVQQSEGASTAEVVTDTTALPRPQRQYRPRRVSSETKVSESNKAANLILSMLEAFGTTVAGPDAAINPMERILFESSLPQMIQDMESETFRRVQQIALPGIFLLGCGAYTVRVWNLYIAQHPPDDNGGKKSPSEPLPPVQPVVMETPANGREYDLTTPQDFRAEMSGGNRDI